MKTIIKATAIAALSFASAAFAADGTSVSVGEVHQIQNATGSYQEMDLGSVVGDKKNGTTWSNVHIDKVVQEQYGANNYQYMIVGRNNGEFAANTQTNVWAGTLHQTQGGSNSTQSMKIGNLE